MNNNLNYDISTYVKLEKKEEYSLKISKIKEYLQIFKELGECVKNGEITQSEIPTQQFTEEDIKETEIQELKNELSLLQNITLDMLNQGDSTLAKELKREFLSSIEITEGNDLRQLDYFS